MILSSKDPRRMASLIISVGKPAVQAGSDDAKMQGLESAAEEMLKAIEEKNASSLVEALKGFVEMCGYEKDDDSYGEEEGSREEG